MHFKRNVFPKIDIVVSTNLLNNPSKTLESAVTLRFFRRGRDAEAIFCACYYSGPVSPMIVHAHEGAGLEVFWRHRGTAYWSHATALQFLTRLRLDRSGIQSLRGLLAGRLSQGLAWLLPEEEILQRVAKLISTGRIIVVENSREEQWPNTGLVLESRWQSYMLLCRDDLYPARDMAEASRWIHKLQEQQGKFEAAQKPDAAQRTPREKEAEAAHNLALDHLRERLKSSSGMDYSHLHNHIFLAEIENALRTNRLIPVYHAVSGHAEPTEAMAAPPPSAAQQASPDREDPESATFGLDHSGASQAATLQNAARDGVPFCEVCQRGA